MFKPLVVLALFFVVLVTSIAEESIDVSTEVNLPKCQCICRISPIQKRVTRRRCRRNADLCRLRRCERRRRRGVICCIIFRLVKDEDVTESVRDASDTVAAPYPAVAGSCGESGVVHNFFGDLSLNDGTSLTRVKIAFCVSSRDIGKRMFDGVVDATNTRFDSAIVKDDTAAREVIREEAVIASAFALGYY